jgi:hypothetical protein
MQRVEIPEAEIFGKETTPSCCMAMLASAIRSPLGEPPSVVNRRNTGRYLESQQRQVSAKLLAIAHRLARVSFDAKNFKDRMSKLKEFD